MKCAVYPYTLDNLYLSRLTGGLSQNDIVYIVPGGKISEAYSSSVSTIYSMGNVMNMQEISFDKVIFVDSNMVSYEEYENAIRIFIEKKVGIVLATGVFDTILHGKFSQNSIEICKGKEIVIDSNTVCKNKQEIKTPIISVMGVGYNVSKFDVQLYLREMFLKKGYKIAQIGTKRISNMLGFYSIPDFMFNNKFSSEETIFRFNEFVKKVEDEEKPDIIIIGVPEPILSLNKKHPFSFGIRAYEIFQAIDVDYSILTLMSGEYGEQFEVEMKNVCKYRYNIDIDDFFVSDFSIVSNSLYSSELKYVYIQKSNAIQDSKNFFYRKDLENERWFNKIEARLKKFSMFEQF